MKIEREVHELHDFFQAWFCGNIPQTDAQFRRVKDALGAGFALISPGGQLAEREPILESIYAGYGQRSEMRIWIEKFRLHHEVGNIVVATYEEWQTIDGETTARLSTVLFQKKVAAPNGVAWLHVHETWCP